MKTVTYFKCILVALIINSNIITGQVTTFQKIYPTTYDKTSRDIMPTSDGGYLIVGSTNNSTPNDCDVYIIKTNSMGDTVVTHTYGGGRVDYVYSMVATSDGNFFVAGLSQSFGAGDEDIYLLKLDQNGALLFQKTYGSWGNEEAREIVATADGNYVIVGQSNSPHPTQSDVCLMKIDLAGNVLWTKYYGGSSDENANSVKLCGDGGFIIGGATSSYGQGGGDVYIIRTNSNGDTTWTKNFGGPLSDEAISVVANADGSFVFCVRDSSYGAGDIDTRVMKLDVSGNVVWNKIYGGTKKDTPKRIINTTDGGYMVGAISRSFGWINPDMWLLKLDAAGDTTWSRHFGGPDHEHCHGLRLSPDGGYLAVGHSRSYSPGQKIMFLKLDINGKLGPVGIEELQNDIAFSVFPNPSAGQLNIVMDNLMSGPTIIKLSNALGQVMYQKTTNGENSDNKIDLSAQAPGVYWVSLQCLTDGRCASRKIILN